MAYKGYCFKYNGTRAAFWTTLQAFLIGVGWELHDDVSATVKVYKSNGESGKEPYGYVWFDAGTSTYLQLKFYRYWDAVNHVGHGEQYGTLGTGESLRRLTSFQSTYEAMLAGNKDQVLIASNGVETSDRGLVFGHVPHRYNNALAYVMGTAGTAGTLTVSTTAGFYVGQSVTILDNGTAGVQTTNIIEMVDSTTVKVASLNINFGTGSVMGSPASTFGYIEPGGSYYRYWWQTAHYLDSGTSVSNAAWSYMTPLQVGYTTLHHFSKKTLLAGWSDDINGISDVFPTCNLGCDCVISNNNHSISGTAACTGTHGTGIIDGTQLWGTNAHTGKMVLIVAGTGGTQFRKITGNDATSLTVDTGWYGSNKGTPGTASSYVIADVLYRSITQAGPTTILKVKITDTTVPT